MSNVPLRRAERVTAILERLSVDRSLGVAELAEFFGVSQATLRRDLQSLQEQRLLTRTHGGARASDVAYELPIRYRDSHHREQKRRIAAEAVRRIPQGIIAVGLTGGTTTSEVARLLVERNDLTVVTNALNIAAEMALRPRLKLVVTGGVSRSQSYELVGPWAERTLLGLNVGIAFVGVDGISAKGGLTTHDEVEAKTNAVLIGRARFTIVVADGSKVGHELLARIVDVQDVDELITDDSADESALEALRRTGIKVTLV
ncbi:MAG TPA: DeoR/GlpR family DNA-binding transcription regulator [Dermatophilaceae bacterium]